jgi:hypothetical protein
MTRKRYMKLSKSAQRWLSAVAVVSDPLKKRVSKALFRDVILALQEVNWAEGGIEFLYGEDSLADVRAWPDEQVEAWRERAHAILSSCLDGVSVIQIETLAFRVSARWDEPLILVTGPEQDLLDFALLALMKAAGLDRLRRCDCGRIWVRLGKLEACSPRCQKRVYMRTYREKTGERNGKTTRTR